MRRSWLTHFGNQPAYLFTTTLFAHPEVWEQVRILVRRQKTTTATDHQYSSMSNTISALVLHPRLVDNLLLYLAIKSPQACSTALFFTVYTVYTVVEFRVKACWYLISGRMFA